MSDPHSIDSQLLQKLVHDALVWSSLHGLVVGDRNVERSGLVPGVGMVHAPIALLPNSFPESHWNQACELAPIFNELVDRVSLDGKFLQDTLSRTKKVDVFTSRLLDIHSRMLQMARRRDSETVAVIYFRAGYGPTDYPSESEWKARLLLEESAAIKCPSISYHLTGTKKVQQELAKPNILQRFLENKDDITKLRACFAGLWSLDDSDDVKNAIEEPGAYVMKPQREGNNIYGDDVRDSLLRLQKEGSEEEAAYILVQRIFPTIFPTILVREGICYKEHAISELGIFSAYLRNKEKVVSKRAMWLLNAYQSLFIKRRWCCCRLCSFGQFIFDLITDNARITDHSLNNLLARARANGFWL